MHMIKRWSRFQRILISQNFQEIRETLSLNLGICVCATWTRNACVNENTQINYYSIWGWVSDRSSVQLIRSTFTFIFCTHSNCQNWRIFNKYIVFLLLQISLHFFFFKFISIVNLHSILGGRGTCAQMHGI